MDLIRAVPDSHWKDLYSAPKALHHLWNPATFKLRYGDRFKARPASLITLTVAWWRPLVLQSLNLYCIGLHHCWPALLLNRTGCQSRHLAISNYTIVRRQERKSRTQIEGVREWLKERVSEWKGVLILGTGRWYWLPHMMLRAGKQ